MKAKPPLRRATEVQALETSSFKRRSIPYSTWDVLRKSAEKYPDQPCLTFFLSGKRHEEYHRFSFREMFEQVNRFANLFHYLGLNSEGVVGVMLPNTPEALSCILAAETSGRVLTLSPVLAVEEITRQLNLARAQILVTLAPVPNANLWQNVEQARRNIPSLRYILQVDPARYLTNLQRLGLRLSNLTFEAPGRFEGQKVGNLGQVAAGFPGDHLSFEPPKPDRLAGYFPTGGTTGKAKLVPLTQQQKCLSTWSTRMFFDPKEQVKFFCGLPLFHNFALVANILVPWSLGLEVVLGGLRGFIDRSLLRQFWPIMNHHQVGAIMGVPPFYARLLGLPKNQAPGPDMRYCFSGDALLPQDLARAFEERYGHPIIEGYGFTEGTCVLSINPPKGHLKPGSAGIRIPYTEMMIARVNEQGHFQRACKPGEIGKILTRGPMTFSGYLDVKLADSIWVEDPEGGEPWFRSGDLGTIDDEGYFYIKGREVEQIQRGKHLIISGDVEEEMMRHPDVELCALVPRPDIKEGQVPVLYVQPVSGKRIDKTQLLDFAREQITHEWERPADVRFLSPMPLSPIGKIYKPALIAEEIEYTLSEALKGANCWEKSQIRIFEGEDRRPQAWITLVGVGDAEAAEQRLMEKIEPLGIPFRFEIDIDGFL